MSRVRRAAFVVGDGDFFPTFDVAGRMDGFAIFLVVPSVLSIWKTAVVNAAYRREIPPITESGPNGRALVLTMPPNACLPGKLL